ncbi:GAF domain-containing protein [Rubellimicrobium rubrum]|uniref:GAF domain-containing protein n=1 Tax=Rubellimicrobium rubrum TaxID=2585369 RepID=A0A5C4MRW7_9RHOB|nr:GAF domain-containing protein [Rubellimicrobium rubrum]TNC48712.1 GAF domain-containing protein [Rubellimicrobium rubrum]
MRDLEELCRQTRDRFGVRTALVTLVSEHRQVVLASSGGGERQTPRSVAFCDHTIRRDAVLVVPDATRDPRFARSPLVTGWPFLRFYAGAPLVFARGARIGSLCLLDTAPHELTRSDAEDLAQTAERTTGLLLERAYEASFERIIA